MCCEIHKVCNILLCALLGLISMFTDAGYVFVFCLVGFKISSPYGWIVIFFNQTWHLVIWLRLSSSFTSHYWYNNTPAIRIFRNRHYLYTLSLQWNEDEYDRSYRRLNWNMIVSIHLQNVWRSVNTWNFFLLCQHENKGRNKSLCQRVKKGPGCLGHFTFLFLFTTSNDRN